MIKYWVTCTRIKDNKTEETFEYGAEFLDLKDKEKMDMLLRTGKISTSKPNNIPKPPAPTINHFELSQPYKPLPEKSKVVGNKKSEKDK